MTCIMNIELSIFASYVQICAKKNSIDRSENRITVLIIRLRQMHVARSCVCVCEGWCSCVMSEYNVNLSLINNRSVQR